MDVLQTVWQAWGPQDPAALAWAMEDWQAHLARHPGAVPTGLRLCTGCSRPMFLDAAHGGKRRELCEGCNRAHRVAQQRARRGSGVLHTLTCASCYGTFEARRADARYCCEACKQAAWRYGKAKHLAGGTIPQP